MVDEETLFHIAGRIHNILEACEVAKMLTPDERISLQRTLDVALDKWGVVD